MQQEEKWEIVNIRMVFGQADNWKRYVSMEWNLGVMFMVTSTTTENGRWLSFEIWFIRRISGERTQERGPLNMFSEPF